ncbi:MAG: hypothetical protein QOI38_1273 [Sphingomonadales bacterium]|nr:hypothetical protein [Sphingomonadales bacterium]
MNRAPPAHTMAAKSASPRGAAPSARPHVPRPPWMPVQLKPNGARPLAVEAGPNLTGLPDGLKAGVEAMSGLAMDDVRVHRNSSEPAKLGALAYARGSDIHLGPGEERQLPHEAWHVVQLKLGRVAATTQAKGGSLVNDNGGLEREADVMGARAARARDRSPWGVPGASLRVAKAPAAPVAQRNVGTAIGPPGPDVAPDRPGKTLESDGLSEGGEPARGEEPEFAAVARAAIPRIEKAVAAARDTIELDGALDRIKSELGLKAIMTLHVGTPRASIAFEVNPWFFYPVSSTSIIWKMAGTQQTPVTKVHWQSDDLKVGKVTAKVGRHMIAAPLAPDHEPGSVSTEDSSQKDLMAMLANSGEKGVRNEQKYIKGHLLNDHVGGPGAAFNLFPITADANAKHLAYVEKFVKAELLARNVIGYEIFVNNFPPVLLAGSAMAADKYSIDASFDFHWQRLDVNGNPMSIHTDRIESIYEAKGKAPFDVDKEYAGKYDTLNLGKRTPKANPQAGQWQVSYSSPAMASMGPATQSAAMAMPTGYFVSAGPASVAGPDFSGIPVKQDAKGFYISVRNSHAAPASKGGKIQVDSASAPVTVAEMVPMGGGWTRIYF